jgi:putative holliday junction resolvase
MRPGGLAWRKAADDNGGHANVQPPGRAGVTLTMPALLAALKPGQRLLGLDPGSKTIGVAVSDVGRMIASPHVALRRARLMVNATEILALAQKLNAGGLVVGLPLSMDGTLGPAAQAARDWARALSEVTGLPTALWDERLSSAAVNRFLIDEADLSRARRAALVDRMAAAYLLQAALDASGAFGENRSA